ncbi:hypothetical protein Hanom_Chr15g01349941 [Helianthus anomalus]
MPGGIAGDSFSSFGSSTITASVVVNKDDTLNTIMKQSQFLHVKEVQFIPTIKGRKARSLLRMRVAKASLSISSATIRSDL